MILFFGTFFALPIFLLNCLFAMVVHHLLSLSAAFGAPIGGVLFSLEEGASFWDQGLTWRAVSCQVATSVSVCDLRVTSPPHLLPPPLRSLVSISLSLLSQLFCAMCSTLTLNLFLTATPLVAHAKFGELDQPGLVDFGRFYQGSGQNLWTVQYIFLFAAMGAVGGLMGAWFNSLNKRLTIYRMKNVFTKNVSFKLVFLSKCTLYVDLPLFDINTLIPSFPCSYYCW